MFKKNCNTKTYILHIAIMLNEVNYTSQLILMSIYGFGFFFAQFFMSLNFVKFRNLVIAKQTSFSNTCRSGFSKLFQTVIFKVL